MAGWLAAHSRAYHHPINRPHAVASAVLVLCNSNCHLNAVKAEVLLLQCARPLQTAQAISAAWVASL